MSSQYPSSRVSRDGSDVTPDWLEAVVSRGADGPISLFQREDWNSAGGLSLYGFYYHEGSLLSARELASLFDGVETAQQLMQTLSRCTGPFTFVLERTDRTLVVTGPTPTSTMLFYSPAAGGYVTDRYQWLERQLPIDSYSESDAVELLQSGRIHGEETLHPEIFQLQPGQILSIPADPDAEWTTTSYYTPPTEPAVISDREQLFETVEQTLDGIFARLKQAAEGRPVLFSLSGGYDSRLVALMLVRHGIEDVYAYTLNTQSSFDIEIAGEVADRLGFEWVPFEYSQTDLREMYESTVWHQINDEFGTHGTAEPHPTTAVTLQRIRDHPDLPSSGICVMGDTPADAVGNYLPESFLGDGPTGREEVIDILIDHYFSNKTLYRDTREAIGRRITELIELPREMATPTAVAVLSRWHWLNQASRMRHGLFRSAGFEPFYPFNEREFYDLLPRLPVADQYDRRLFEAYTEQLNEEYLDGLRIGSDTTSTTSYASVIKTATEQLISQTPLETPVKTLRDRQKEQTLDYGESYESSLKFGYMSFDRFRREYTGREHYSYFLAKDELSRSRLRPDGTTVVPPELDQ
jgi:asparagine synthase (glutamine-hydrolysing)